MFVIIVKPMDAKLYMFPSIKALSYYRSEECLAISNGYHDNDDRLYYAVTEKYVSFNWLDTEILSPRYNKITIDFVPGDLLYFKDQWYRFDAEGDLCSILQAFDLQLTLEETGIEKTEPNEEALCNAKCVLYDRFCFSEN